MQTSIIKWRPYNDNMFAYLSAQCSYSDCHCFLWGKPFITYLLTNGNMGLTNTKIFLNCLPIT